MSEEMNIPNDESGQQEQVQTQQPDISFFNKEMQKQRQRVSTLSQALEQQDAQIKTLLEMVSQGTQTDSKQQQGQQAQGQSEDSLEFKKQLERLAKEVDEQRQENERIKQEAFLKESERALNDEAFSADIWERTTQRPEFTVAYMKSLGLLCREEFDGRMMNLVKDQNGDVIYSKSDPTRPATVSEGIEVFLRSQKSADELFKFTAPAGGSGAKQGGRYSGVPTSYASCGDNIQDKIAYLRSKTEG